MNEILIRHRSVLRSALPTQIVNALDERQEKIRQSQIAQLRHFRQKVAFEKRQQQNARNESIGEEIAPSNQQFPPPPPRNQKIKSLISAGNDQNSNCQLISTICDLFALLILVFVCCG